MHQSILHTFPINILTAEKGWECETQLDEDIFLEQNDLTNLFARQGDPTGCDLIKKSLSS